jgi:hypothetical protein
MLNVVGSAAMLLLRGDGFVERVEARKMNSALIAVIVEQYNKIVELEVQVANLNQARKAYAINGIGELNEYLMDNEIGVVGDMTAKTALDHIKNLETKLESKTKSQPDPPEPEDAYLGDFRVLKTAISIVLYAMKQKRANWELDLCRKTVITIRNFTEEIRRWDGLDDLEPYKWSSIGSGVYHLVDKEWKK